MNARCAIPPAIVLWLVLSAPAPAPLVAQAVRGQLDLRLQSVAFERHDETPGVELVRAAPLAATLDLAAWDFGVERLSLHVRATAAEDLSDAGGWPATEPPLRLLEGYLEYSLPTLTARAGRTYVHTRLGYESFDGARVDVRPLDAPLTIIAFGGWSLLRGSTLPVTSPEAGPPGEFRPPERGVLVGGALRATAGPVRASAVYRREVDPAADRLASELLALSASARVSSGFSLAGGADYDLGYEEWGSAEAQLGWNGEVTGRVVGAGVSVRRHRPRFPLWSIWGAFSPVAYTAWGAHAAFAPIPDLTLHGRGERFGYEETNADLPLVTLEDEGWRWTAGAGWTRLRDWSFAAEFGAEFGPGASSTHARLVAVWRPVEALRAGAWIARGTRPLEYRIDDAIVRSAGLDVLIDVGDGVSLDGGLARYDEQRESVLSRDFGHWRFRAGIRYSFGTRADRTDLHPVILRIPERPGS